MPTNITNEKIKNSFSQLLHIDGGPEAAEKSVLSATGTATALKLGTGSASVDNVRLDGNTISTLDTDGNLILAPNGTGSVSIAKVLFTDVPQARTALGLGTMATQAANNVAITGGAISGVVFSGTFSDPTAARAALGLGSMATQNSGTVNITGGSITGVTFTGSFTGVTSIESTTFATSAAAAGVNLNGNTLAADGTDTNIDINITPKGTGEVNITNVDILSGKVPYATITGRAFASFSDITDQTGSTTAATPVKFGTAEIAGSGITMVTDGTNLTRLTFAAAGTYMVAPSLQFANSDTNDHDATIWFALNGTAIARSATRITVPRASDGGAAYFQIVFYVTVTAGQHVQVMWLPETAAVTLDHTAAGAIAPATPSAIVVAERIA